MYESHFGLSARPFPTAALADRYFAAAGAETARQTLSRVIDRAEGPAVLIGSAGIGKTLLLQVLAGQFAERFRVATLATARLCTRRALLQNILFELKLPYRGLEEGELRLSLIDHLEPGRGEHDGLLLLVDEAHALPFKLLEELRLITNLVRDGQPRVRLILAGNSSLEEHFAHPKLASFNQRLAARVFLTPFSAAETRDYIQSQFEHAGGSGHGPLTEEAVATVHQTTSGVPRLINQLCDHSLLMASLGGWDQIDASGIEEAWADLQQLPLPSHHDASQGDSNVVEFGSLDDDFPGGQPSTNVAGDNAADEVLPVAVAIETWVETTPAHSIDAEEAGAAVTFETDGEADGMDRASGIESPEIHAHLIESQEVEAEEVEAEEVEAEEVEVQETEAEETEAEETEAQETEAEEVEAEETEAYELEPLEIEAEQVNDIRTEQAQFDPMSLAESEVELVFHGPHELGRLFGDTFDEEEVVVDRYAMLEDEALRNRTDTSTVAATEPDEPPATLPEGERITPHRRSIFDEQPVGDLPEEVAAELLQEPADGGFALLANERLDSTALRAVTAGGPFDPADDPVMPDTALDQIQSQIDVLASRGSGSATALATPRMAPAVTPTEAPPQPVAAEPEPIDSAPEPAVVEPPTRRVFGQLFATLRHQ